MLLAPRWHALPALILNPQHSCCVYTPRPARPHSAPLSFKRNRLRHKQNMLDMEAEVARKLQQLQALAAENSALKTKAEVSGLHGGW